MVQHRSALRASLRSNTHYGLHGSLRSAIALVLRSCLCVAIRYGLHGSLRSAIGLASHMGPTGHLFVFQVASCPCLTSCAYAWGGLLRKPPLKGARITRVARISSICSLNTNTYRRAVTFGYSAPICAWAFGPHRPTYVHTKFVRTWGPLELVHKVVHLWLSYCVVAPLCALLGHCTATGCGGHTATQW